MEPCSVATVAISVELLSELQCPCGREECLDSLSFECCVHEAEHMQTDITNAFCGGMLQGDPKVLITDFEGLFRVCAL